MASAFFLVPSATVADAPHTHSSVLTTLGPAAGDSTVSNGRVTLTIDAAEVTVLHRTPSCP